MYMLRFLLTGLFLFFGFLNLSASPRIQAGLNTQDCLVLFYINSDNELIQREQLSPGGSWGDEELYANGVESVFLFSDEGNGLILFYIDGQQDAYMVRQNNSGGSWEDALLFREDVSSLDVVYDAGDLLHVFFIATDHKLMQCSEISPGTWSDETEFAPYASALSCGKNLDGRLEIFYALEDHTLNHRYQLAPSGDWSSANYFAASAVHVKVALNEDGRQEVFFIDNANILRHRWQVAPSSGWDDPAVFASHARSVVALDNTDERLEVFYTDDHDYLCHRWQNAINSGWHSGEQCGWEAFETAVTLNQEGCLEVFYLGNNDILFHNRQLEPGRFWTGEYPLIVEGAPFFSVEQFDDDPVYLPNPNWHVNDHCFITDPSGYWHMFGIVFPDPFSGDPTVPDYFGHAGADDLSAAEWIPLSPPFHESVGDGNLLWAPHIVKDNGTYYMFYCGGGATLSSYEICLRTSEDLTSWSGYQVLFADGIQARDPMVLWVEEEQCWVMYYTATFAASGGYYIVAYRTSDDLVNWSERHIAYTDYHSGTTYGNTESPFVVNRGPYYYLFLGPRPYDLPSDTLENWEHPGYVGTDVYRSTDWRNWNNAGYVGHIEAHAPEITVDGEGNWYISHCGVLQGGLYLTSLTWLDGVNAVDFPEGSETREKRILTGCFPNPFITETSIHYALDEPAKIRLDIYNSTGLKVRTLLPGRQAAGNYSLSWDGTDDSGNPLPQGVYYCRLETGSSGESLAILVL